MAWVLVLAILLVALANGANDNAKGVGALIGSRMAEARPALRFANLAALIGSLAALVVAVQFDQRLVKGLCPARVRKSAVDPLLRWFEEVE